MSETHHEQCLRASSLAIGGTACTCPDGWPRQRADNDRVAPRGFRWVCMACGKWAKDRYGIVGEHSRGWDESCMLNSELRPEPAEVAAEVEENDGLR